MPTLFSGFSWLIAALLLASCTAQAPVATPEPPKAGPTLGALDGAYDRTKWTWSKNADGRMLLKHTQVDRCFLDPEPPLDLNEPGLTVTREAKSVGRARYQVVTAYEGKDFWEAVYVREGSRTPVLGVYAGGACQQEAEKILEAFEKRR